MNANKPASRRSLKMLRILTIFFSVALVAGCADLNRVSESFDSLFTDNREQSQKAQQYFDSQKAQIENAAQRRQITWVDAARRVKELDRSLAGRGDWKFDSREEEYHAYCILLAEQVDAGRMVFTQYDALRTRKFNEINRQ